MMVEVGLTLIDAIGSTQAYLHAGGRFISIITLETFKASTLAPP